MKKAIILLCSFLIISCGSSRNNLISITETPIEFNEHREQLTLQYMKERYGMNKESPTIEPKMIVQHWTAISTLENSFNAFRYAELPKGRTEIAGAGSLNVSAHFLVDRDGTIYRLMPETIMARHVIGLNHVAIGVENVGGTQATPLTEEQLQANIWLVEYLKKKFDIEYIIGHHEYNNFEGHELWLEKDEGYRTKKSDPGEAFMKKIRAATQHLQFKPIPKLEIKNLI